MKALLRNFLINLSALWITAKILPGLDFEGGVKILLIGAGVFMVVNWLIVPLIRLMFLPLNLLTLGIFGWAVNVVGLYLLTVIVPEFKLIPFSFPGANLSGMTLPAMDLNLLQVAIVASLMIGLISHFMHWLVS